MLVVVVLWKNVCLLCYLMVVCLFRRYKVFCLVFKIEDKGVYKENVFKEFKVIIII